MATFIYSTPVRASSDALFQSWIQEFYDKMIAGGLVQTSDTGQIAVSPVTLVRGASNTFASGYLMFRMNDALAATTPLLMRFEFGNGGLNVPAIRVQFGMETNGAGNFTGVSQTAVQTLVPNSGYNGIIGQPPDQTANYPTYMCVASGFFGLAYKLGRFTTTSRSMFSIFCGRTTDSAGANTSEGWHITVTPNNTDQNQGVVQAPQNFFMSSTVMRGPISNGCVYTGTSVYGQSSGGRVQLHRHHHNTTVDGVKAAMQFMGVPTPSLAAGDQFSVAVVGATARNYLFLGQQAGVADSAGVPNLPSTNCSFAMLWE